MKILVTGATGYVGGAVVRALAARGHTTRSFARHASRSSLAGERVDGDVRDSDAVARAVRGCDAVCHMAALVSIWQKRREDFDDVNLGGLRNIVHAAADAGISRVLYTSSFLALAPRDRETPLEANDYQRTKLAADRWTDARVLQGAPIVRVYPGVVYGPGPLTEGNLIGRLVADHLNGRLPGLVGPEHPWSYAYVDDVAAGHCAALERGRLGGRYILGGENTSQQRVFAIVTQLTGRRPPRRIPFPIADLIGTVEEMRARVFGGVPLLTRGAVEIFRHDWSLDSEVAIRELGYSITPLADGISRTIEFIRRRVPVESARS